MQEKKRSITRLAPNWFEYSAAEHRAVREKVGMFDMSSFGKIKLMGRDAEAVLQLIAAMMLRFQLARLSIRSFKFRWLKKLTLQLLGLSR